MGLTGPEPIIETLKTALQTYLPAKLTSLEATAPAQVLTAPANADYHVGDRQSLPNFPALLFDWEPSSPEFDKDDRINVDWKVLIGVFVTDPDEEKLFRRLWRYTRAISEVLWDRRKAGDFTNFELSFEDPWDPTPHFANENGLFERDAFITVTCWKAEERV